MARERTVSGRIQIQVWYHDERKELVVAVLAADDLAPRDESLGFGSLPEAYARLCLMPLTYVFFFLIILFSLLHLQLFVRLLLFVSTFFYSFCVEKLLKTFIRREKPRG